MNNYLDSETKQDNLKENKKDYIQVVDNESIDNGPSQFMEVEIKSTINQAFQESDYYYENKKLFKFYFLNNRFDLQCYLNKEPFRTISKLTFSILLFILWILFYKISLFGCPKSQAECLKEMTQDTAVFVGIMLYCSSFSFVLLTILTYFKLLYVHFTILSIPVMVFLFYYYDTGADFAHHGSYNRAFFYFFCVITYLVLGLLYCFIKILVKHPIKTIIFFAVLIFSVHYTIQDTIDNSCEYWNKGFKNTTIDNTSGYCKIPLPQTCFLHYTSNFWDVSRLMNINCAQDRTSEEFSLLRDVAKMKNVTRLGYPRTESWNFFPDSLLSNWNWNIFKSMVNMDDPNQKKNIEKTEVYIDFTKPNPEVNIQIKKNETLIFERSNLYNSFKNSTMFKNILYIYIDSLSRNHFRRKLPKTFKWLEEHYQNPESPFSSYQFLKYHSLTYYTYANMIPGYFGVHKFEDRTQKAKYFLHFFKDSGYITGQSYDVCCRETWDLETAFEPFLDYTNYDHEMNPFYCDPNFSDPERPYGALKGAYSVVRKCMYGKDAGEYQIEYVKQFFDTYQDQPKFFRLAFLDAHEGTGEVIKFMDEPIVGLLNYLKDKGHLGDSTLLKFQSDHGVSMPGPIYIVKPKDYFYEIFLPTLFYLFPKNITNYEIYNQNLLANENKFITSFDTHAGLVSYSNIYTPRTRYGLSLFFYDINETSRTCEFYKIEDDYCMCKIS